MAVTPYLYYQDVAGALKFLSQAFGFRSYGTHVTGPDGKINHAAMKIGRDVIMMGCPGSAYRNPTALGQTTQSLYIMVDDVDAHFRRASRSGATILQEPSDTEYGQRRYGAADPEGHEWSFAHEIRRPARTRKRIQ